LYIVGVAAIALVVLAVTLPETKGVALSDTSTNGAAVASAA
jgi:hypothetical protein